LRSDRSRLRDKPPACCLGSRVGDLAGKWRSKARHARNSALFRRQAAIEIVALEADQRFLSALDHRKGLAAAFQFRDGEEGGGLDAEIGGDGGDFGDGVPGKHGCSFSCYSPIFSRFRQAGIKCRPFSPTILCLVLQITVFHAGIRRS
jgi:hypothetical protein